MIGNSENESSGLGLESVSYSRSNTAKNTSGQQEEAMASVPIHMFSWWPVGPLGTGLGLFVPTETGQLHRAVPLIAILAWGQASSYSGLVSFSISIGLPVVLIVNLLR